MSPIKKKLNLFRRCLNGTLQISGSAGASEPLDPNGGQKFGILSASEDVVDLTEVVGATVGESSPQKVPSAVEPSKTTPSERDPESGPNDWYVFPSLVSL